MQHEVVVSQKPGMGQKLHLWVIVTRNVAPIEAIRAVVPEHLAHQVMLEKQGILFGAGPLSNETGERTGTGLILIRAADAVEARRIADSDPLHAQGLRSYTLQQWSMNEGRISISLDLSDGAARYS